MRIINLKLFVGLLFVVLLAACKSQVTFGRMEVVSGNLSWNPETGTMTLTEGTEAIFIDPLVLTDEEGNSINFESGMSLRADTEVVIKNDGTYSGTLTVTASSQDVDATIEATAEATNESTVEPSSTTEPTDEPTTEAAAEPTEEATVETPEEYTSESDEGLSQPNSMMDQPSSLHVQVGVFKGTTGVELNVLRESTDVLREFDVLIDSQPGKATLIPGTCRPNGYYEVDAAWSCDYTLSVQPETSVQVLFSNWVILPGAPREVDMVYAGNGLWTY